MVMHVELPILAGHVLMATDMLESMGHERRLGNNVTINLELEDRSETERLFGLLSDGGNDLFGLADMPWGAYWGTCATGTEFDGCSTVRTTRPGSLKAGRR